MEEQKNNLNELEEKEVDLRALFFQYLYCWPWFVASVIVCCITAFVFLRYQTPVYNVSSSVLIKEDDKKGGGSNPMAALEDMGMFSMTNNFDNEVEILKSRTLVRKVVNDLRLYISLSEKGSFRYNKPLYKKVPLNVYMTPEEAERLESPVKLEMDYLKSGKLSVEMTYFLDNEELQLHQSFDKLPAVMPTPVGVISFTEGDSSLVVEDLHLFATIVSPTAAAISYVTDMSIAPSSKTTTIAKINVKNTIKQRGIDFINTLVAFYNQDTNNEKNEVAQKTAEFIEERIAIINSELSSTENALAAFKQRSGLTDLTSDAQMSLQERSKYEQLRTENATQIRLVQYLNEYINNPANKDEVLPANVGLQDQNLTSVIDQYNTMLIERKRLLRTSSESNPAVINMNTGIDAMRRNVQTTVTSVLHGLQIEQKDIERQASKFEGRISSAPEQEKEFMTISRQQEIKATLYIMLLQKREENAITLASTANNGRIIEEPLADKFPVAPKKMIILLAAFVIGLCIPIAILFLIDFFKYRIEGMTDVERLTSVPVVAEISTNKQLKGKGSAIVVRENKNDIMEETFRGLRTNILFMLDPKQKVILVSSSIQGEGKSFVTGNLATSLAFLGKKVVVVGLDIRKPGLNKVFDMSKRGFGITNYLRDPENVNLFDMIQKSQISENLDILFGGPVPPNPTELVTRNVLDKAIELLKERYDYVILDTAPIAIVTDTAIIGRVADMCVYVCRADYTPKESFRYVNVLQKDHKFDKLAVVLNGVDMSKRKNRYGYGYGSRYGYGKHYGYGYGYGYGFDAENKK